MITRMTAADYAAGKAKDGSKKGRVRGTKRTTVDGITFDSKIEAEYWFDLRNLERAGIIKDLRRQVPYELQGRDGPILTPTGKPMTWRADYVYYDKRINAEVVVDRKGHATDIFNLKKAILAAQGVEVEVV